MGRAKNTVLFVDDEIHIINSIRRATMDVNDFESVFANSGQEALQIFVERDISVIVTDMRMPGMDGLTLLKEVREIFPKTIRIVLSGYTQLSQVLATINHGDIFQFIPKPWKMEEELFVVVRQAIEHFNLEAERDNLREGLQQKNKAYENIFRSMEQKLASEKKDILNLKRINHWTFSFWRKQLEMTQASIENKTVHSEYVDLIEELQLIYLASLPAIVETKTIRNIIADISKACAGRMATNTPENADLKISGYHSFLAVVCKALVYLTAADDKTQVLFEVAVDIQHSEAPIVTLDIEPQLIKLSAVKQNRLKIGCSLLNEMGSTYNIKVLLKATEGEIGSLRVSWETSGN